jgi:hypothetical protein
VIASDNVMVTLAWDETYPGWQASAKMTTYRDYPDGSVGVADYLARSECVQVNPMKPIIDVLDLVCQEANTHPARLGEVVVVFSGEELHDTKDRTLR